MRKRAAIAGTALLAAAGLVFVLPARSAERRIVRITLREWKITMTPAELPVGVPLEFEITNTGKFAHELVVEKAGDVDNPLPVPKPGGGTEEMEIENINPGQTKKAVWTIPAAGDFQVACHMPTHYMNGMVFPFKAAAR
jgi:uncharacterized cupredoxin-like copper-binding protein